MGDTFPYGTTQCEFSAAQRASVIVGAAFVAYIDRWGEKHPFLPLLNIVHLFNDVWIDFMPEVNLLSSFMTVPDPVCPKYRLNQGRKNKTFRGGNLDANRGTAKEKRQKIVSVLWKESNFS